MEKFVHSFLCMTSWRYHYIDKLKTMAVKIERCKQKLKYKMNLHSLRYHYLVKWAKKEVNKYGEEVKVSRKREDRELKA